MGLYDATYGTSHDQRWVRYWGVLSQQWHTAYIVEDIPDGEFAAMSREDRERTIGWLDHGDARSSDEGGQVSRPSREA